MASSRHLANTSAVSDEIFGVVRRAFGRAYAKIKGQSEWESYSLILFGGGSLFEPLRRRLHENAEGNLAKKKQFKPKLIEIGLPPDLVEADGAGVAAVDGRFLLTAYGLSHLAGDVPETLRPTEIEPWDATARRVTAERSWEDVYGK